MTGEELVGFWPLALLDERPKSLFVDYSISGEHCEELADRGWCVCDVRRLPNQTDADRAESLKCLLEGIRVGSITPDKDKMRWMELEAKVYGLLTGKDKLADVTPKVNQEVLDNLLDFGGKKVKIR
jgi:hypothetical protein|tara:strand:- start:77 stop:454 length:378 start_codon:yes stop_codon:yes gene_type:complete